MPPDNYKQAGITQLADAGLVGVPAEMVTATADGTGQGGPVKRARSKGRYRRKLGGR